MDRAGVRSWLTDYERAWRSPGTDSLAALFASDGSYRQAPYDAPVIGLEAISRMWEQTRDGPDEVFTMTSDIVAVDDDTAVVRLQVRYSYPVHQEYRDLWIIAFAADGRCRAFEEWPFWPGTPHTAG